MHDVLVKAWAMWGDYLENIFVKERQLHLGVSAITCYLHACRHQNESKSRKYLAKVRSGGLTKAQSFTPLGRAGMMFSAQVFAVRGRVTEGKLSFRWRGCVWLLITHFGVFMSVGCPGFPLDVEPFCRRKRTDHIQHFYYIVWCSTCKKASFGALKSNIV